MHKFSKIENRKRKKCSSIPDIIHEGYIDNGIDLAPLYEAVKRCESET